MKRSTRDFSKEIEDRADSQKRINSVVDSMCGQLIKYINHKEEPKNTKDNVISPFGRPLDEEDLKEEMLIRATKKGRTGQRFSKSVSSGLDSLCSEFSEFYKYVYKLQAANPNKASKVEALRSVFAGSVDKFKDQLENALDTDSGMPIILCGERGSGKSTIQNHFFNTNTGWLEEKGYIWVRCDAHKLYEIWEDVRSTDFDIQSYLNAQLAYITVKYSKKREGIHDKSDIFNKIIESIKDISLKTLSGNEKGATIIDWFEKKIDSEIAQPKSQKSVVLTMIENNLRKPKSNPIERSKIDSLSEAIHLKIKEKRYKLLYVIDGADNISQHETMYSKHYRDMLADISRCFKPACDKNHAWLISLRPETVTDLNMIFGIKHAPENIEGECLTGLPGDTCYIHHYPPPIKSIFDKKLKVSLKPESEEFKQKRKSIQNQGHDLAQDNLLQQLSNHYLSTLGDSINELMPELSNKSRDKKIDCVFGGNIRALTQHKLSMLRFMMYSDEIRFYDRETDRPNEIIGHWFVRNLFLNGNVFMESISDDGLKAYALRGVLPNIFGYDKTKVSYEKFGIWQGLCGLRLLQTAVHFRDLGLTEKNIEKILNQYFGYDKELIKSFIKRFIVYGLIKYSAEAFNEDMNPSSATLKITPKGTFCMRLSFHKADIIYFLALDTYISCGSAVTPHLNNKKLHDNFTEAVIRLAPWFCKHLHVWHKSEMDNATKQYVKVVEKFISPERPPPW